MKLKIITIAACVGMLSMLTACGGQAIRQFDKEILAKTDAAIRKDVEAILKIWPKYYDNAIAFLGDDIDLLTVRTKKRLEAINTWSGKHQESKLGHEDLYRVKRLLVDLATVDAIEEIRINLPSLYRLLPLVQGML